VILLLNYLWLLFLGLLLGAKLLFVCYVVDIRSSVSLHLFVVRVSYWLILGLLILFRFHFDVINVLNFVFRS